MAERTDIPTEFAHLKRLSRVRSMAGVVPLTPAVHPGNHCPMHTALSLAARTAGVSTLVVGTPECAYYSRNVPPASSAGGGRAAPASGAGGGGVGAPGSGSGSGERAPVLHWTYVLDTQEVVFGCRDGVAQAIREMDGAGTQAILIISTCVPEVNGEDIASLCDELQPQVRARLMQVRLGNYTCGGYEPGNRETLLAFRALVERADASDGSVNVMGREPDDDHTPLPALLSYLAEQGVRLRFIGRSSDARAYAQAGRACANLVISPFFDELAGWMKRELGISCVSLHSAYAADDVLDAYRQVGEAVGFDAADVTDAFATSYAEARAAHEELARLVAEHTGPLRYVCGKTGAVQPLPLIRYLASLGMVPLLVHMEDFCRSDRARKRLLVEQGIDPLIGNMLNASVDRALVELLKPAFVLDDQAGTAPTVRVSDLYGHVGFERTGLLCERLASVVKGRGDHGAV